MLKHWLFPKWKKNKNGTFEIETDKQGKKLFKNRQDLDKDIKKHYKEIEHLKNKKNRSKKDNNRIDYLFGEIKKKGISSERLLQFGIKNSLKTGNCYYTVVQAEEILTASKEREKNLFDSLR